MTAAVIGHRVGHTTRAGSRIIALELSPEAQRGLTVEPERASLPVARVRARWWHGLLARWRRTIARPLKLCTSCGEVMTYACDEAAHSACARAGAARHG